MRTGITAKLLNALGLQINPATEEKQDDIITAIGGISGASNYSLQLDNASATIVYIGEATIGSATASAVWRIKRMDKTSGNIIILWADGDELFNNIWDNRASLSYS